MVMDLVRTRPYSVVDRLFDQALERAFQPFSSLNGGGTTGFQSFPVNVWETNDAYHAAIMVPGLDEQSINVTAHEDTLSIEGELTVQMPEDAKIVWQEFGPTKFRRSLRLGGSVDPARVEATYRNGILLVTMPKAEHAKPRQIPVRVGVESGGEAQALPKGANPKK